MPFEKKTNSQSWGILLQNSRATQPISWGPKSYKHLWNQSTPPAGDISPLLIKVTHSHVTCHCQAQRPLNPFLGVLSVTDAPWTQRASHAGGPTRLLVKRPFHYCVGYCGNLKLYGSSWSQWVSLAYDSFLLSSITHINMNIFPSFLMAWVH